MSFAKEMTNQNTETSIYWLRNLVVCSFGAFTTIVGMTLLLPFLPLYVQDVGIQGDAAIAQWSGIIYGATYFSAALVAPLWGRLGDRYGRKLMLIRASFGMAICIALMGLATNIWQLFALRILIGCAGGYASGAAILAATQTPKHKIGWALGIVSSGVMAGNFIGPLIGGILPNHIGIRSCFLLISGFIFITFLATIFLIKEEKTIFKQRQQKQNIRDVLSSLAKKTPIIIMLLTGTVLMFANMSIEPIITIYVKTLIADISKLTLWAGIVMSLTALGSALSASFLGRLADKIGHSNVLIGALTVCAIMLIPQAFVTNVWQLAILRFLMGVALGGLIPCITSILRNYVPDTALGTILGFSVSAQYVGQVSGPVTGGFIAGHIGMKSVFFMTAIVMMIIALLNYDLKKRTPNV